MANIGIFGGTFNPPHLGHKRLAFEAAKAAGLDKIIVIPDAQPPHKDSPFLADGIDRLEMCRRTFCESLFEISDIELKREGKSYTVDTLTELKKLFPDDELFLIIGSDMLLCFDKWRRFEDILSMVTLVCLSRESAITSDELLCFAKERLGIDEGGIIISDSLPFEVSSTEIRRMIALKDDASDFLAPGAYRFIKERRIYLE